MTAHNILIKDINHSHSQIVADGGILRELYEAFSFYVDGYKFMPPFKMGRWDGMIHLVDMRSGLIPKGLIPDVIDFARNSNYSIALEDGFVAPFKEDIPFEWEDYDFIYDPKDFQEVGVERCLKKKRQIILSSTGSGKSFIIHAVVRALLDAEKKILIIVPSISLVSQMFSDFQDYSANNGWDASEFCHLITAGVDKDDPSKEVYISTWQSIVKLPQSYFEQFDAVIGDEVHLFQAKSCTDIMNKCHNASIRLGFTGTLNESKVNELQLKGLFGPVHRISNTSDLMDDGTLAMLTIKPILLKYKKDRVEYIKGASYVDEMNFITADQRRLEFVKRLALSIKGNTLVLFNYVDKHGRPIFDSISAEHDDTHFVYGGVGDDDRTNIKKIMDSRDGVIVVASSGVFSTGLSVKKIDNIIFASPTKSKIRVMQSIGRGLRVREDKSVCVLYDIGDNLTSWLKKDNHTMKHFRARMEMYIEEGFVIEPSVINNF